MKNEKISNNHEEWILQYEKIKKENYIKIKDFYIIYNKR
jgi:hypothetical protein